MNRQITLAARPVGMPQESDFALVESEVPRAGPGEVLVRSLWLSLDPYMRGRMSEARSYAKPTQIGEPMTGQAVGEVVESGDPRFAPGDIVVGQLGWQELRGRTRRHAPQGRPVARADPDRAACARRHGPDRVLRALRRRAAEARRHGRRLGRRRSRRPDRRPAREDRRLLAGRRRSPAGRRRCGDLTELYGYDTGIDYKSGRRQRRAQGGVPERRRRVLRQRRWRALRDRVPAARPRRARSRSAARSRSTTSPSRSSRRATSAS